MSDTGPCYCSECSSSILKRTRAHKSTHWPWGTGLRWVYLPGAKERVGSWCVMDRCVVKCTYSQTQVSNLDWAFYILHCHSEHLGNTPSYTMKTVQAVSGSWRAASANENFTATFCILQCQLITSHHSLPGSQLLKYSKILDVSSHSSGAPLSSGAILYSTAFIITADGTEGASLLSQ